MAAERIDIPLVIGGKDVRTGDRATAVMPHDHRHVLADWHKAGRSRWSRPSRPRQAAHREWSSWPWEDRAAVFLKRGGAAHHHLAVDPQRGHHARPVQDRLPGRDRLRL